MIPERDLLAFEGYNVHNEKIKEKGCSKRIICKERNREDCHFMSWLDVGLTDLRKGKET